jgi:hypothetical protein
VANEQCAEARYSSACRESNLAIVDQWAASEVNKDFGSFSSLRLPRHHLPFLPRLLRASGGPPVSGIPGCQGRRSGVRIAAEGFTSLGPPCQP